MKGTSMIFPLFFDTNERKTLTHISYLFHIQREDHADWSVLAHIHKSLIHCLSYNIGIKAHVQLLLPLFCTISKHYILPVICKQNLSKFQAIGNKKFQYHSDQNSSVPTALRGWLGSSYRNCSLEQEVSTGVRVSVSSWSENRNAILT